MLVTELSFADLWAKKNDHLISSSGTIHYPNRKHKIRFLPYIINTNKKLKKNSMFTYKTIFVPFYY